jgi:hypothetical protein
MSVQGKHCPLIGAASHLCHTQGWFQEQAAGQAQSFHLCWSFWLENLENFGTVWRRIGKQARVSRSDREVVPLFESLMSILPGNFSSITDCFILKSVSGTLSD